MALVRFESTSNHALLRLYKRSDMSRASFTSTDQRSSRTSEILEGKRNILTSHQNEHVFLVYLWVLDWFQIMIAWQLDPLASYSPCKNFQENWLPWSMRWKGFMNVNNCDSAVAHGCFKLQSPWSRLLIGGTRIGELKNRTNGLGLNPASDDAFVNTSFQSNLCPPTQVLLAAYLIPEHRITHPGFPKIKPHAPNTVQTPARDNLPFIGRVKQSLWVAGARMQEQDIKFAIKAGMATATLAAPAFFDTTRPFFIRHWGDWALISVRGMLFFILSQSLRRQVWLVFCRDLSYYRSRACSK